MLRLNKGQESAGLVSPDQDNEDEGSYGSFTETENPLVTAQPAIAVAEVADADEEGTPSVVLASGEDPDTSRDPRAAAHAIPNPNVDLADLPRDEDGYTIFYPFAEDLAQGVKYGKGQGMLNAQP